MLLYFKKSKKSENQKAVPLFVLSIIKLMLSITRLMLTLTPVNVCNNSQSKVKKSKVNNFPQKIADGGFEKDISLR